MTLVGCVSELLGRGDFSLVRRLWGHFISSWDEQQTAFSVNWSRSETLVSSDCFYLDCNPCLGQLVRCVVVK